MDVEFSSPPAINFFFFFFQKVSIHFVILIPAQTGREIPKRNSNFFYS